MAATRLFVGGINYRTTAEDLVKHIESIAPVALKTRTTAEGEEVTEPDARIIWDRELNRSKGFGFVEMQDEEGAKMVIEQLNDQELDGRRLKINIAEERPRPAGNGYNRSEQGGGNGRGYDR